MFDPAELSTARGEANCSIRLNVTYPLGGGSEVFISVRCPTAQKLLRAFEVQQWRAEPADYFRDVRIVEAMVEEARLLGVWPPKNPLENLPTKIRLARALNVHRIA